MYFYILHTDDKNPKTILDNSLGYIHVKARNDGKQIAIISAIIIKHENAEEKTIEELQEIIDNWINEENENPEKDIDDNLILQEKIDLKRFLRNG